MDSHIHFSPECLDSELLLRLENHIAAGHPWKQLLQTASKDTVGEIFQTLQAYPSLWLPFESGERNSASFDKPTVLELFNAAEQDLEEGLSFIREVEKGSHMRAEAVHAFRPEAIKAVSDWTISYRRFWEESFDKLQVVVNQMKKEEVRDDKKHGERD